MVTNEALEGIEAVVFDLDDTLFDHTGSTLRALEEWLETMGVTVSKEQTSAWSALEARHFEAWRAGDVGFEEQRRRRLQSERLGMVRVDLPVRLDQADLARHRDAARQRQHRKPLHRHRERVRREVRQHRQHLKLR
jgi:putative hydrolase of the HAD superfamily